MPVFEGCVEAKEISLVPVKRGGGANPHAHVLVRKHNLAGPAIQPETTEMPELTSADVNKAALAIANKLIAMDDVTKKHYLTLDEAGQTAFLEKSATEQAEIAKKASEDAEKARVEEEARKSGKTPEVVALEKSNSEMRAELDILKAKDADREIEKRADTEFAGFPGGSAAAVPLLKAYAKLPEEARKASEDLMKSQCKLGQSVTTTFGARTDGDISKAQTAQVRVNKAAQELAKAESIDFAKAYERIIESPEFADDAAAIG